MTGAHAFADSGIRSTFGARAELMWLDFTSAALGHSVLRRDEYGWSRSSPLAPTTKGAPMSTTQPVADRNLDGYGTAPDRMAAGARRARGWLHSGARYRRPEPSHHLARDDEPRRDAARHAGRVGLGRRRFLVHLRSRHPQVPQPRRQPGLRHHGVDASVRSRGRRARRSSDGRGEAAEDGRDLPRGGWPATVDGDAFTAEFSAPSAGPPPWFLYHMEPTRLYALGTAEPYGAELASTSDLIERPNAAPKHRVNAQAKQRRTASPSRPDEPT